MRRRDFVEAASAGLAAANLRPRRGLVAEPTGVIVDGLSPSQLDSTYLEMLRKAGVTGWHKSMGGLQTFADAWRFADGHRNEVVIATTAAEIVAAASSKKIAALFGWQSADDLGTVSGQKETPLRAYYQLGLRFVNLVYNVMNQFAGGCLEPRMGLTRTGRRLVEEIHGLNMVLDVGGHTGEQSSLDALEISRGVPVICSHTNVAALIDNPRNTSDRVFEGIAKTGGVIGLSAINDFTARRRRDAAVRVTPQVSLPALLDHYDYLKRLVGVDHIGLGCDFTHGMVGGIDPTLPQFGTEMASAQSPIYYVKGFENITELPNLVDGLKSRGWTEAEVAKVLGGNWLRVYASVFGA